MRPRLISALLLLFASAGVARAQAPEWELFGGASFMRASAGPGSVIVFVPGGTLNESLQQNSYGWIASVTQNVTGWFGGTAEFSGYYANRTVLGVKVNGSAYPFLFGPDFKYRRDRLTLFARPLFGGADARVTIASTNVTASQTRWAYDLGGGADYKFSRYLSVRVEGDWLRTHFPDTLERDYQNNFRVSGGLVWTIGKVHR